ncbi:MAG TPA: AAA family ATPase, partial [Spirochaetota bacterium]|nr:AAA family ATPase [Spirochaetota bacterium]
MYNVVDVFRSAPLVTMQQFINFMSRITGIPCARLNHILKTDSRLRSCELINGLPMGWKTQSSFGLNELLIEYIDGRETSKTLLSGFVQLVESCTFPLESFSVAADDTAMMLKIIKEGSPFNILLHGEPGTGKTEYAKSIIHASGCRALFVNHKAEIYLGDVNRKASLYVAMNVASGSDILVVDEADQILNTEMQFYKPVFEKGWLNDLIDKSDRRIIWITNKISEIESSHLRRFEYNVQFRKFNSLQRECMWRDILSKSSLKKIITEDDISHLSSIYTVNAAGIATATRIVEKLLKSNSISKEEVKGSIERILIPHEELTTGKKNRKNGNEIVCQYDPKSVNTDISIERVLDSLKRVTRGIKAGNESEVINANLLFYG